LPTQVPVISGSGLYTLKGAADCLGKLVRTRSNKTRRAFAGCEFNTQQRTQLSAAAVDTTVEPAGPVSVTSGASLGETATAPDVTVASWQAPSAATDILTGSNGLPVTIRTDVSGKVATFIGGSQPHENRQPYLSEWAACCVAVLIVIWHARCNSLCGLMPAIRSHWMRWQ
jgi:microcystin-dependent protein